MVSLLAWLHALRNCFARRVPQKILPDFTAGFFETPQFSGFAVRSGRIFETTWEKRFCKLHLPIFVSLQVAWRDLALLPRQSRTCWDFRQNGDTKHDGTRLA
jgi:hypothetical protein